MIILIIRAALASLFIIAVQPFCFAQTTAQSKVTSTKLEKSTLELLKTTSNLNEIDSPYLPDSELINNLYYSTLNSYNLFDRLWIITSIHSLMIDSKDQQIVKGYVSITAKSAIASADISTNYINKSLAGLKTQAAILELSKARDLIQLMRGDVSQLIPPGK
jgi:hypothetical protein